MATSIGFLVKLVPVSSSPETCQGIYSSRSLADTIASRITLPPDTSVAVAEISAEPPDNDAWPWEERPTEGPWGYIRRSPDRTTYHPRRLGRHPRFEWTLPSGNVVVDDLHAGTILRAEYYARADLAHLKPIGRKLSVRAHANSQATNSDWFCFSFQERYDDQDALIANDLVAIEAYVGTTLVQLVDVADARGRPTSR